MEQVAKAARQQLITQKLAMWKYTAYDISLDAKVGALVGNKEMEANAETRLKEALKAVDFLEKELETVKQEVEAVEPEPEE